MNDSQLMSEQPVRVGRFYLEIVPMPPFEEDVDDVDARGEFVATMQILGMVPGDILVFLSPRQAEVVWHICRGLTLSKHVGQKMGVTENTVKAYLFQIFEAMALYPRNKENLVRTVWPVYEKHRVPRIDF